MTPGSPYNEHWRPTVDLCRPCQIQYDVIGKYETLSDDAWLVLHKANLLRTIKFPYNESATKKSKVRASLDTLTEEQFARLYKVYELDFRLFDYDAGREIG